jgi:hypothetical protein
MPEFKFGDPDWHEGRQAEEMASGYGLETPSLPDGMTREEWLTALGYSAPRPPETEKEPSSKDRLHKKQLRNWRGWQSH